MEPTSPVSVTLPPERPLWSGSPSQIVNLGAFIGWGLLCWLVIPLFIILWRWLEVHNTRYELSTERLKIRHGILNKKMDELELYRVRDYKLEQPFFLRMFGFANILLTTADRSNPSVTLRAIAGGEALREQIRNAVETCRVTKRVREVDLDQ
jgi:uncharacterized membrane protein YdbT with pleckstrin-like domain